MSLALLAVVLASCTNYQDVDRKHGQTWQEARRAPYDEGLSSRTYVVRLGDTVSGIAERFGTTPAEIVRLNGLSDINTIFVGQTLRLRQTEPRAAGLYAIREGDTLSEIANTFGYRVAELELANPGINPNRLYVGDSIRLPGDPVTRRTQLAQSTVLPPANGVNDSAGLSRNVIAPPRPSTTDIEALHIPPLSGQGFMWPVRGPVLAGFGRFPNGSQNDGINIGADLGEPVRSAENGVVIYVGTDIKAFGNTLLIQHSDGYLTTYAHLDEIEVAVDQNVERGDVIATVGQSGSATRPQLHFELRLGIEPLDPNRHLLSGTTLASR